MRDRRRTTTPHATDYSFRLYVAGRTARSQAAVSNLRFLCESHLVSGYEIEVIDAVERPDLAEQARILATPTVVRLEPLPQLRVIGDLSDHGRAAAFLGLPDSEDRLREGGRHDR